MYLKMCVFCKVANFNIEITQQSAMLCKLSEAALRAAQGGEALEARGALRNIYSLYLS